MPAGDAEAWLAEARAVLREVLRSDVAEFELSGPELRLRVKRRAEPGTDVPVEPAGQRAEIDERHLISVAAPLTGIFYGAPSPGARPYVGVGEWAESGAVVGLIEAMKVFNEVTAERPGRVARILATDGSLVHGGEPLLLLDPDAAASDAAGIVGG